MKAMILAAGLGTRLRPLTSSCPKALVKVGNKPMLEHLILKLMDIGISDILVNVHHYADQIISFLEMNHFFGIRIQVSNESDRLLDTGGAIKKGSWFFNDGKPFLVHNVDIITDFDMLQMKTLHLKSEAIATLAVRQRESGRYLLIDDSGNLCGWKNNKTGETIWVHKDKPVHPVAFSGVQILNPSIFSHFPEDDMFSIIKAYLAIARYNKIDTFVHNQSIWLDAGNPENLELANKYFKG
jgi:NDP-sugar pyrophosphorylase family protein